MSLLELDYQAFWGAFAIHLWQSTLVVGLLVLLGRLLRGAPARFHGYLWWVGLLKLILPAALLTPLAGALLAPLRPAVASVTVTTAVRGLRAVFEPELLSKASVSGAPVDGVAYQLLTLAWLLGALVVALTFWRRRSALLRQVAHRASAPAPSAVARAARRHGIDPALIELVDQPIMPCLVGVRRTRILLPRALCRALSEDQLSAILAHEDAHRRLGHPPQRMVALLALVPLYFFPVAWLVLVRLHRAAELACDEAVVHAGVDARTYARTLARTLRFGFLHGSGELALVASKSVFKTRLRHLQSVGRTTVMRKHRVAVALAGCLFTVSSVAGVSGAPQESASGDASRAQARLLATQVDLATDFPHLLALRGGNRRADIDLANVRLSRVLGGLAGVGGFELDRSHLPDDRVTTLAVRNSTVASALATLARSEQLWFELDGRQRLVVREVKSVGGDLPAPERILYVAPSYPKQARDDRIQGTVILEGVLGLEGRLERSAVLRGVHPLLDDAARDAMREWRYTQVIIDGKPVKVRLVVTVQFQLQ